MKRSNWVTVALALLLVTAAACSQGSPANEERSDEAPVVEEARQAPRVAETRQTEAQRLGTLPEGVGIPSGEPAPEATATDADGRPVRLHDLVENGPVLLVFYRGGWCPFCNFQIRELTEEADAFAELGITPVAISVDRMEASARTRATYDIPFPVLSDPDLTAHRAFRVLHEADAAEVERLKSAGMDVEQASGRDHHTYAIPSLFLVDREGVVRWSHASRDYKTRPSTDQVLGVLRALASAAPDEG